MVFPVAGGMAYMYLYLRRPLMKHGVVFISAAKMKTHNHAMVTLSMKNLFGLPPWQLYRTSPDINYRFKMYGQGVNQSIIDLNLLLPIDFAVVDGIWAMEGRGPVNGDPVKMDVVLAGSNATATDRVCLEAMGIPQDSV